MSGDGARGWPLVGREDEIQAIESGFRRPGVLGVVLTGGRGVGRSRLAQEAAGRLAAGADSCRVERVTTRKGWRSTPYAAIAHLVSEAAEAVSGTGVEIPARLAASLRAAGSGRTVVVVDDVHLLDGESAAALAELAARRVVFLLGTVVLGGAVPEAVSALWSGGELLTVPVRPLSTDAMERLIGQVAGLRLDPVTRRSLAEATGRNPLALQALVETTSTGTSGHGTEEHGPAARWLDEAGPQIRAVVELVACGDPMPLRLLEKLASADLIDAAEHVGMVRIAEDGEEMSVRVAPPLSAPLVRFLLGRGALRRIHRRLLAAVLPGPVEQRDVLRAGAWQLRAGTFIEPEHLLPAARQALERFDLELAADLADAARHQCPDTAADLVYSSVLSLQGRSRRAAEALPSLRPDDPALAADWAVLTAEIRAFGLGQPAFLAERALEGVARDRADAHRAWVHLADGRGEVALRTAGLVLAAPDAGARARVWAAAAGTTAAGLLGRAALSESIFSEGLAAAEIDTRADRVWAAARLGFGACLARLLCGNLHAAQELADEGYTDAVALGARPIAGIWAALRGSVAKAQGRVRTASEVLQDALMLIPGEGWAGLREVCRAELSAVTAMTGDSAWAGDSRSRLTRSDAQPTRHNALFEPWIALNQAWTHVGSGDLKRAANACRRAAAMSAEHGFPAQEAMALYDAARLGAAGAVQTRLAELESLAQTEASAAMATAARGLARRDEDALGRATEAFTTLGYTLLAAETATAAAHARYQRGRQASAAAFQERAEALADACEGAHTPLLDRWRLRSRLTPREREVVLLAPTATTPQIAARLGLSPRTVSNYLQRAYDKLGLTGRAELRVFLGHRRPAETGSAES